MTLASPSRRSPPHRGFSYWGLTIALLVLLALGAIGWAAWSEFGPKSSVPNVLLHTVARGDFLHEISDRGEIESSENVEIRSEVKSGFNKGTMILQIVPEGEQVQEGDLLVVLDSSALELDRTKQQIVVNNSEAAVIQGQNVLETAKIAKKEYLRGKYLLEKQQIQSKIVLAEEDLRRAQEYLAHSERLAAKGYVTELQLEADRFAVEKARIERDKARTELNVLDEFTKAKMLGQLESDIATAEAKLQAVQSQFELEEKELADIDEQIAKCKIYAPQAGQVVYANVEGGRGRSETIIEEGAEIRERQVIIRLPDFNKMQVKARINEGKVSLLEEGMPARVRLDAFTDMELKGTVESIAEFAASTSFFGPNVKEYETIVRIHDPPRGLRPGMTAEVKIEVERLSNVLRVPVQTIFEHEGKYYAALVDGSGFRAAEVRIGSTNDEFVVIRDGLEEGQKIAQNAAALRDDLDLPETAETPPTAGAKEERAAGGDEPPKADSGSRQGVRESPGSKSAGSKPSDVDDGPASDDPSGMPQEMPSAGSLVGRVFDRFDGDGDGKLSSAELEQVPEEQRGRLKRADTNGDGNITRPEMTAAINKMMKAMQGGGFGGPGGDGPPSGGRGGPPR